MRSNRIAVVLSAMNLVLLAVLVLTGARRVPPGAEVVPVLRARELEIVDERGLIRSRINVEKEGGVVLRMMGEKGTIRVKLGAGEDGSGLLLADETTEPGLHFVARRVAKPGQPNTTMISLQGAGGKKNVIRP